MKTFAEQVADLKATRAQKAQEMKDIAQKSIDESRSMDAGEAEQFDTLEGEVKRLDADIARLSRLADIESAEAADKATAKPVDATQKASAPATGGARLPVQVKNTEKLEPGIAFARMARVKALAHLDHADVIQVAQALYPQDESLIKSLTQKAAVPAANTLTATWAGNLINDGGIAFADFVEYLRPRSLVGRISGSLRRLPFDTPVMIQTHGGSAKWVKEGDAKPLTQWQYTRTKLSPLKVAAIAVATKETIRRASVSVDALIRDELARSVAAAIDTTFLSTAAAVSDESPAGILNGVTPLVLSGGGTDDAVRCDAQAFMNEFVDSNQSLAGAFWVMPERVAIALSLMQNALGQPAFPGMNFEGGTFLGIPVFVTNYADTNSDGSVVALVKGDEIFLGDEGGIEVSMSDQASLVMDNAPSMDSTTPTAAQVVSMYQTNSVAFLVERIINWQKRRTQSVVWGRVTWDACAS